MADFLLHRCAALEGIIPFILQNFEFPPVASSIETVKDDKSSELVSLACSTVSLTVHMWGAESCQNLYNKENLNQIAILLEIGNSRNQRLILKLLRKSIQNKSAQAKIAAHSKTVAQVSIECFLQVQQNLNSFFLDKNFICLIYSRYST